MDEPRQSAAVASRYLIPIGLGVMLVALVWPEQDSAGGGPLRVHYSRLLGIGFEGVEYETKLVVATIVSNLQWLVVAVLAARRWTRSGRLVALGAAGLLGIDELLFDVSSLLHGQFLGFSTVLSAAAGVLLIAGVVVGLGGRGLPEIHGSEGVRA